MSGAPPSSAVVMGSRHYQNIAPSNSSGRQSDRRSSTQSDVSMFSDTSNSSDRMQWEREPMARNANPLMSQNGSPMRYHPHPFHPSPPSQHRHRPPPALPVVHSPSLRPTAANTQSLRRFSLATPGSEREEESNKGHFVRTPELKVSHKIAERKRRQEMRDIFDELKTLLPMDQSSKTSKWEILKRAAEYVRTASSMQQAQLTQIESLREEVETLKRARVE